MRLTAIVSDQPASEMPAPVSFGRMHLGPALFPLLARHPRIELTLELDDRRIDAAADGHDAVVRHGTVADTRLVAWRFATSRPVLVAAPSYLSRHGAPASVAELEQHHGIFYTNRGIADCRFQGRDGAAVVRGRAALRVNNGDVMRDAAIAGLGIALLPTFVVGAAIRARALIVLELGAEAEAELVQRQTGDAPLPTVGTRVPRLTPENKLRQRSAVSVTNVHHQHTRCPDRRPSAASKPVAQRRHDRAILSPAVRSER